MEFSDDKPYVCHLCEDRFPQKQQLANHMHVHSEERPFACTHCPKKYKRKQHLTVHLVVHTGERPFKCPFCEDTFKYQSHMIIHRRLHTGVKESSCPECRKGFASKQQLEAHKATHSEERPFACPYCEKRFKYQCDLYYHRRIHIGGVFQCKFKFCKYWTPQKNLLAAHLKTHTGERNHKCDLCDKAFIERTALLKHIRAIHENLKPFKCEKCDYSAAKKASLMLHVQTVHDGVRRFVCDKCDFRTNQATRLQKHVLKEHADRAAMNEKTDATAETVPKGPLKEPKPDASATTPVSKSARAPRNSRKSAARVRTVEEGRNVPDIAGSDFEFLGTLSTSAVKEECVDLMDAIVNACKAEPKDGVEDV
ncbi:hypothetical protein AAVH_24919 [Aphelenchoides avenae]|nr:hypothetical protein AAVH_24919 [Aphelenchus avenae]